MEKLGGTFITSNIVTTCDDLYTTIATRLTAEPTMAATDGGVPTMGAPTTGVPKTGAADSELRLRRWAFQCAASRLCSVETSVAMKACVG